MIYKRGNPLEPTNYRGIALINNIVKIFTRILTNRLTNWVESEQIIPEEQVGFRRGRGCRDAIFSLASLISINLRTKRAKLYGIFVDFQRAFDCIPHAKLWEKLNGNSIYGKCINVIKD